MIYNERVTIYTYETTYDELGSPVKKRVPKIVPCARGSLTHNQQIGIFGKYNLQAFKIHLQGVYPDIDEISYKGTIRSVQAVILHKNATVVVV